MEYPVPIPKRIMCVDAGVFSSAPSLLDIVGEKGRKGKARGECQEGGVGFLLLAPPPLSPHSVLLHENEAEAKT